MSIPSHLIWPQAWLHQALPLLAKKAGYIQSSPSLVALDTQPSASFKTWLTTSVKTLQLKVQETEITYIEVNNLLSQGGPALLALPEETGEFLVLLKQRRGKLLLLGRDKKWHKVSQQNVHESLTINLQAPLLAHINSLLKPLSLPSKQYHLAKQNLLNEQLSDHSIQPCWLLGLSPSESFWKQLFHAKLPRQIASLLTSTVIIQALLLITWAILGKQLLTGNSQQVELQFWALLMLSAIPFQVLALRAKNRIALSFGSLLRSRLLHGIFHLKPDEVQRQGSGQFLSYLMDIELLEALGLSMALTGLIAIIQVCIAGGVLALGVSGLTLVLILLLWLAFISLLSWRYYRHIKTWLTHYRMMSCDLTEKMVGHRTRLVQEDKHQQHTQEDKQLEGYAKMSIKLDRIKALIEGPAGRRGWLIIALFTLFAGLMNTQPDLRVLAISIGAILLAASAIDDLTQSIRHLLTAKLSWDQLQPLYQSAQREQLAFSTSYSPQQSSDHAPLIELNDVSFSHAERLILKHCHLRIHAGQHILLEGSSGSGKSTLASILAGLHQPDSGKIMLSGTNSQNLSTEQWRKKIVLAPQFQENHIFTESLAFNVLLGRHWPPSHDDLLAAENVCRALKLGQLIDTMPAGMQQIMGESGWQLSHGERSRLFIARSLLQNPDLIILDESFTALDPDTLKAALGYVLQQRHALLLIAHP